MSILGIVRPRTFARAFPSPRSRLHSNGLAPRSLHISQRCLSDPSPGEEPEEDAPRWRVDNKIARAFDELDFDAFAESVMETVEEDTDPNEASEIRGAWKAPIFPTSPLMNPEFLAARQKYKAPKPLPSGEPTTFQRRLAMNPYAIALATPIRLCQMTRTPMPSFFLQDIQLAKHPNSGSPIYVPRGVFLEPIKAKRPKEKGATDSLVLWHDRDLPQQLKTETGERIGPGLYVLASKRLMGAFHDVRAGFRGNPLARLMPARIMKRPEISKTFLRAHFRKDMHEFILELARRRIFEMLVNLNSKDRNIYLSGYDTWSEALTYSKSYTSRKVVFLWTRPVAVEEGKDVMPPGEFATIMNGRWKVPLHNMEMLLGQEKLEELRQHKRAGHKRAIFNAPIVKIKSKNMTMGLQLRLWWLQCYLAEHKHIDTRS